MSVCVCVRDPAGLGKSRGWFLYSGERGRTKETFYKRNVVFLKDQDRKIYFLKEVLFTK